MPAARTAASTLVPAGTSTRRPALDHDADEARSGFLSRGPLAVLRMILPCAVHHVSRSHGRREWPVTVSAIAQKFSSGVSSCMW